MTKRFNSVKFSKSDTPWLLLCHSYTDSCSLLCLPAWYCDEPIAARLTHCAFHYYSSFPLLLHTSRISSRGPALLAVGLSISKSQKHRRVRIASLQRFVRVLCIPCCSKLERMNHLGWMPPQTDDKWIEKHSSKSFTLDRMRNCYLLFGNVLDCWSCIPLDSHPIECVDSLFSPTTGDADQGSAWSLSHFEKCSLCKSIRGIICVWRNARSMRVNEDTHTQLAIRTAGQPKWGAADSSM